MRLSSSIRSAQNRLITSPIYLSFLCTGAAAALTNGGASAGGWGSEGVIWLGADEWRWRRWREGNEFMAIRSEPHAGAACGECVSASVCACAKVCRADCACCFGFTLQWVGGSAKSGGKHLTGGGDGRVNALGEKPLICCLKRKMWLD